MKDYIITGIEKIRDLIEAEDEEQAKALFLAKYPATTEILDIEERTYKIVRKYKDNHPDHDKEIATGLTLAEAREHCKDPESKEDGVWFDCFYQE
jgi:hypothetical protein